MSGKTIVLEYIRPAVNVKALVDSMFALSNVDVSPGSDKAVAHLTMMEKLSSGYNTWWISCPLTFAYVMFGDATTIETWNRHRTGVFVFESKKQRDVYMLIVFGNLDEWRETIRRADREADPVFREQVSLVQSYLVTQGLDRYLNEG